MLLRLLVFAFIAQAALAHMETSSCGVTKKCVFVPSGCQGTDTCRQIFSYNTPDADGWTDLEMFSTNDSPLNNYMAVGFSDDDIMGDDYVTQCVFQETAPAAEVHVSYNFGKSNAAASEASDMAAEKDHLELVHSHKDEHGMFCQWRQKSIKTKNQFLPDLNKSNHVFLARGKARKPRDIGIHSLDPSSPDFPFISDQKINVGAQTAPSTTEAPVLATGSSPAPGGNESVPGAAGPAPVDEPFLSKKTRFFLVRLHGILMITAWFFFIALAILSARYLRDHFPNSHPFGLKWWFHIHRTLNLIAVPMILLSTLIIFFAKGWTWKGPVASQSFDVNTNPGAVHSLFGTMAIIISLIQPVMSLLRCAPDTGARPIFNWTHRILGITGVFFALIATTIASTSFAAVWSDSNWSLSIVLFYIVILLLAIIIFEILTYMKQSAPVKTHDMELRGRGYDDRGRVVNTTKTVRSKPLHGISALYAVFALFALCVSTSLIIMLII